MKLPLPLIISLITPAFNVPLTHIRSESRAPTVVRCRFVLIYLARVYSDADVRDITRFLGGRHYTLCTYAHKTVRSMIKIKDPGYVALVEKTETIIKNHLNYLAV